MTEVTSASDRDHRSVPLSRSARILYIASSGIREPLIVSQVVRYLRELRASIETCHLITFERASLDSHWTMPQRAALAVDGIHWHPLPASDRFRAFNIWRETSRGYRLAKQLVHSHNINLIHARSFLPGRIGLLIRQRLGLRLLYDMRGLWAVEKWAKGTIRYRWMRDFVQRREDRLFHEADRLVCLTHAGKRYLRARGITTPIDVIPCCVDTELFQPARENHGIGRNNGPRPISASAHRVDSPFPRVISVGSLGPGYLPETVFALFRAIRRRWPQASMTLLTKTSSQLIHQVAQRFGDALDSIHITSACPEDVPRYLRHSDVGLCLIEPSEAKIASSPTKLAEYFACGLPVIANRGIGDIEEILSGGSVGVLVPSTPQTDYTAAMDELTRLFEDPELTARCRRLAETGFSLQQGAAAYRSAYHRLLVQSDCK